MYFLKPGEAPATGLRRILRERIDESIDHLARADAAPELAVHEVRKNIKRIRAALRLARFGLGEAVYSIENFRFRDLGRKLAAARDATVERETLRSILLDAELLVEEVGPIEAGLFGAPPDSHAWSARLPSAELIADFRAAGERVAQMEMDAGSGDFIYNGLADTAARARRRYREAYASPETAEKFHEWRKQVKYLWHQFEILSGSPGSDGAVLAEDLEHLSGRLGLAHDAVILHARLLGEGPEIPGIDPGWLARTVHRARLDHEGAARPHGRRLFTQKPEELLDWYPGASAAVAR